MITRITYRLSLIPSIASDTAVGMPVNAITQLMMLDTPIRKMIIPVISALSKEDFRQLRGFDGLIEEYRQHHAVY